MAKIIETIRKSPLEYGSALLAVAAIVMAGFAMIASQAAGPFAAVDASKATVADGATIVSDAAAASGKAVQFANATTPPPTVSNGPRGKAIYQDARLANDGRPAAISGQPYAVWLGGWSGDPAVATKQHMDAAAAQGGKIPVFVLYNIPLRDCGLYSAGGLANFTEYKNWINGVVSGIGQREAMVILEPDALAGVNCDRMSEAQRNERLNGLSDAVTALTTKTKAYVYIDAGNAGWRSTADMANLLKRVGVDKARGFALNVSNFFRVSESTTYGNAIAEQIGGKSYLIDTSRNANGVYVPPATATQKEKDEAWCNPPGRGLGVKPTTSTGQKYIDAYLWVKTPGESDGDCKGAPVAGAWYQSYAEGLIRNANYTVR